jgi:Mn-dependent DtxR family transcriptional regulator
MSKDYDTSLFEMVEGELRIAHDKIAEILKISPASVKKLINRDRHYNNLETLGKIVFKIVYFLNEKQLNYIIFILETPRALAVLLVKHKNSFKAIEEFSKQSRS